MKSKKFIGIILLFLSIVLTSCSNKFSKNNTNNDVQISTATLEQLENPTEVIEISSNDNSANTENYSNNNQRESTPLIVEDANSSGQIELIYQTALKSSFSPRINNSIFSKEEYDVLLGDEIPEYLIADLKIKDNVLYLVDYRKNSVLKEYSDTNIYRTNTNQSPYVIQKDGIYAVADKIKLVRMNENGETDKNIYQDEKGQSIIDFIVADENVWLFAGGSIYQVSLPDCETICVYQNINTKNFLAFLSPISDFEIAWLEYTDEFRQHAQEEGFDLNQKIPINKIDQFETFRYSHSYLPEYVAHYYNLRTSEHIQREVYPLSETQTIGKGWWFVPINAYETYTSYEIALPKPFIDGGFNCDICCGGGKYITDFNENGGNPVGFTAICYDIKTEFKNGKFEKIVIPNNIQINSYQSEKNSKIIIAKGKMLDINMNDEFQNYYFAFFCKEEADPVYCFALRSDLYDETVFQSIYKSIRSGG